MMTAEETKILLRALKESLKELSDRIKVLEDRLLENDEENYYSSVKVGDYIVYGDNSSKCVTMILENSDNDYELMNVDEFYTQGISYQSIEELCEDIENITDEMTIYHVAEKFEWDNNCSYFVYDKKTSEHIEAMLYYDEEDELYKLHDDKKDVCLISSCNIEDILLKCVNKYSIVKQSIRAIQTPKRNL